MVLSALSDTTMPWRTLSVPCEATCSTGSVCGVAARLAGAALALLQAIGTALPRLGPRRSARS